MSPVEAVRRLEDARFEAIVKGDWDAFENACHPDLRYTHANGVVDTLDSYLGKLRSNFYDYHWIDHPVDDVWAGDGCVLIWGRMSASLRAGERTKMIDNRTLAVWVPSGGQWLLIAQQPTAI